MASQRMNGAGGTQDGVFTYDTYDTYHVMFEVEVPAFPGGITVKGKIEFLEILEDDGGGMIQEQLQ